MDRALILETTFLVDLEREALQGEPGPAHELLNTHEDRELCVTLTTVGELACGPTLRDRRPWQALVSHFRLLTPDLEAAWRYGQIYGYLRDNGLLIGSNDLWIAVTALIHELPLVTRDTAHFRRVPGLEVMGY